MDVGIDRQADLTVPQRVLDDLHRDTLRDQQGRARMAQVVEADGRESRARQQRLVAIGEVARIERGADRAGGDQSPILTAPLLPQCQPFLDLPGAVRPQGGGERHPSASIMSVVLHQYERIHAGTATWQGSDHHTCAGWPTRTIRRTGSGRDAESDDCATERDHRVLNRPSGGDVAAGCRESARGSVPGVSAATRGRTAALPVVLVARLLAQGEQTASLEGEEP
jgi:hypothetical protein